jgi:hypothetical protein
MAVAQERSEMTAFVQKWTDDHNSPDTDQRSVLRKPRRSLQEGWQVHITNAAGHQYGFDEIDQLAAELQSSEMANP